MSRLRSRTSRPDSASLSVFFVWMRLILVGDNVFRRHLCAYFTSVSVLGRYFWMYSGLIEVNSSSGKSLKASQAMSSVCSIVRFSFLPWLISVFSKRSPKRRYSLSRVPKPSSPMMVTSDLTELYWA